MGRKQSRLMMMEKAGVLPEYDGKGVYALVDSDGKMYIGSSTNCRRRVYTHFITMENVRNNGMTTPCSTALRDAAKQNIKFKCVILEKLGVNTTDRQLKQREQFWIDKQGGLNNIYNMIPAAKINNMNVWDLSLISFSKMIAMAIDHECITLDELSCRLKTNPRNIEPKLRSNKYSMDELKEISKALDAELTIQFKMKDGTIIG